MKKYLAAAVVLAVVGIASAQTTYNIDLAHTSANFRAFHAETGYTYGRFDEYEGTLVYAPESLDESSFEFFINAESVNTNNGQRDDHLRSPDFFNVAQFPTLEFVSTAVAATDDADVYAVTGDLTIHGVTNEITVMVAKTGENTNAQGNAIIGFLTEFSVDRTDYGMTNLLGAAGPMIDVIFSFEGVAN
ncbi:MAG: YceI family protein [Deinococcota bacterium]